MGNIIFSLIKKELTAMADILALTGSITSATRLAGELERLGCLNARVVHTPAAIKSGGCSYCVKMPEECKIKLDKILASKKFKVKRVLAENTHGKERVYDDIS